MQRLKDLKEGDAVIVTDVNRQKGAPQECTVKKIGRKYLTVGHDEFVIETGSWHSPYSGHRHVYTKDEWARYMLENQFRTAVRDVANALQYSRSLDHMTDLDITDSIRACQALLEKLEPEPSSLGAIERLLRRDP